MKNIIRITFLFILFSISSNLYSQCVGNCTSVTATLTDSSIQVWSNATVTINIVPPFGNPATLLNSGVPIASPNNVITTNSLGTFTISLDDNAKLTPAGSRWNFIICPNATTANCSTGLIFVTGTSQNLSASLSSYLTVPVVNTGPTLQRAYSDNEANGGTGSIYWNTTSGLFKGCYVGPCPANSWQALGNLGVPGNSTQIPYNNGSGGFSASPYFAWNNTSNTLFTSNSVNGTDNGIYNPTICSTSIAPTWCSGSDLGAWVNAAFSNCNNICIVQIPAGTYTYTTTINMLNPSQSLIGAGSLLTVLNYTGSGDGIRWQMVPFTLEKAGVLRGFSLVGTSSAINCIHSGTLQGSTWEDLTISGCTGTAVNTWGTGANGVLLENISGGWTERTYMHNVHFGYGIGGTITGNTNELHLTINGGTFSFGYSDFDLWFNIEANQIGLLIDNVATIYHGTINLKGNMDVAPSSFLTINGQIVESQLHVFGEFVGSNPNAIAVGSTGNVQAEGNIQITGGAGLYGIAIPNITSGGTYSVEPWLALDYPGTTASNLQKQPPMIVTGYKNISADGTYVIAQAIPGTGQSGDLQGRLILSWPNNTNRMATMILDVSCAVFEPVSCTLDVPVNYFYNNQPVFTSPTIKLNSSSIPQIQVTIGNRNGVTQYVVASWYGAAGAGTNAGGPTLFPSSSLGSTAISLIGSVPQVFANLPSCVGNLKGQTAIVTDSTTVTYNANIVGSGSNTVEALCNGSSWTAH